MGKIYKSIDELVGNTPLLELKNIQKFYNLKAKIFAKLECFNPTGSVKDRVALKMLEDAIKDKKITNGTVIIEATSGNTGIGIAALASAKGYESIIVMPENMSEERQLLMKAYGAKLVLTDKKLGMKGAIDKANELYSSLENAYIPDQFTNFSNVKAHYENTGREIYKDTRGKVDAFVSGIGTGGTITGVSKFLKEKNPKIEIIGVEPSDSPFLTQGKVGAHQIQGIGAGFKPTILDLELIDEIMTITTEKAFSSARLMGKLEGILVGISSGAALSVAIEYALKEENQGKKIVVLMPDGGNKYLSTNLYKGE